MFVAIFATISTIMTFTFTSCFFCIFSDIVDSINFSVILLILLITFYSIFLFSYSYIMDYIEN